MSVLVIQHVAVEGLGRLGERLTQAGEDVQLVRIDLGEAVPESLEGHEALIVLGGPRGVYESDRYPHLAAEIRLIEGAVVREAPVLGVCLGSQLLAAALGARVFVAERKEVGWFPVQLTEAAQHDALFRDGPQHFEPLHWHGDVFDLPRGATRLARSALTENQAFRYGENAYGLLFHLEVTGEQTRAMATEFADELEAAGTDPALFSERTPGALRLLDPITKQVFDRWIELLGPGEAA
jgi:GMP synthase (glutamine-hydrolysing)